MRARIISIALLGSAWLAGTARADQCAWLEQAPAMRAAEILADGARIVSYCEPCGDSRPGPSEEVRSVEVQQVSGEFEEVVVNGRGIDLAYTFVHQSRGTYQNLATLAGCPALDVSTSLRLDEPSSVARPSTAPIARPSTPPTAVPSPEPPAVTFVVSREPAWFPIYLAGAATMAAIVLFALWLGASWRRRRSGLPRALRLGDRLKRATSRRNSL